MSFHRFNQLANSLKQTAQLTSLLPQGLRGALKSSGSEVTATQSTYTPVFGKDKDAPLPNPVMNKYNPHGWKSWRDIPDEMVPPTLGRDPDNPLYETRHYMDIRKKRIWYQIPDGTPVWLKNYPYDHIAYYGIIIVLSIMTVITFKNFYELVRYGGHKKK